MSAPTVPPEVPTLSDETVRLLRETFVRDNHHPSPQMWEGIRDLALCLQKMADGQCDPKFYLSSLDPGVGKTKTIVHFLRALAASPKHDHVGVIVFFSTKQQIEHIIEDAGLKQSEFAVWVTDDEKAEKKLNDLGAEDRNSARVLFTTQQRLQLVSRSRPFSSVSRFYFRGRPRQVRIWDEGLLPAESVTVVSSDLGSLHRPLRRRSEDIVAYLDGLRHKVDACPDHGFFDVPDLEAETGLSRTQVNALTADESNDTKKIAADLWSLANTKVVIRDDGPFTGRVMVSIRESLPPDLAPIVILDASGRVRRTYRWWEQYRKTLVRLQQAEKRYDDLTIRVWNIAGGQWSFYDEGELQRRCKGIANTINANPTEPWLVVCYKRFREKMERIIRARLMVEQKHVNFIHWGVEKATNEYKDTNNIILAGTRFLPASAYEGIGRAARGLRPDKGELDKSELDSIAQGEIADAVLQAACRGAARGCKDDRCLPSNLYVIASAKSRVRNLLPEVFRYCAITKWEPELMELTGQAADLVNYVIHWFEANPDEREERLLFTQVRQAIGVSDASNFKKLRDQDDVKHALAEADIRAEDRGERARAFIYDPPEHAFVGVPVDTFCPHGHIDWDDCPVCGGPGS
jgi:hypothetical protein